jgi:glycerol-3-phosphate dehydrogenase
LSKKGGILAKRTKHSFIKYKKEIDRKKKADEKMARRQSKKDKAMDDEQAEMVYEEAQDS